MQIILQLIKEPSKLQIIDLTSYLWFCRYYNEQHENIKLFKLESISLIRKYIGIMDLFVPSQHTQLISPPFAYLLTHKAMRQHSSQLVWFRWLYVTFSRYMFINDLILEEKRSL
jgi:N-acetylglucosaminylphosphatidylinositol deacetylase